MYHQRNSQNKQAVNNEVLQTQLHDKFLDESTAVTFSDTATTSRQLQIDDSAYNVTNNVTRTDLLQESNEVSWIRGRDLHILTSGRLTFTADPRFSVSHTPGDLSWGLVVKKAKLEDSGRYECQVNTDPKINYNVTLVVKEFVPRREKDGEETDVVLL
ncbi:uncharacterized protein LOC113375648 [Ctenocephalides felis]|uniref:uncharacterized protein LOC113375648 n=1 Tax=Ctenocephalides felis TaxID=7515 RepID=UPI000E6E48BE|nr:uncharacterized protein LOC113375648 [Ctenocephalides felis]